MFYKLSPISIAPNSKAGTTGEIYIGQVEVEKEMIAGKLFILLEIESNEAEDLKIINFLIDDIAANYYQNERIVFKDYSANLNIESLLESTLTKSNKKLLKYCEEQKINISNKIINATVGAIHEDNIFFSLKGKNKALLIAKTKEQENIQYRIYDIAKESGGSDMDSNNPDMIFSNIISGHLPKNGYMIFSNEALPEYLSGKQLIKIITTLPPASAVEQIKINLSHVNAYISFLGIIIKSTVGQASDKIRDVRPRNTSSAMLEHSITNLNNTERSTEKFLAPSGIINFQKWLDIALSLIHANSGKIKNNGNKLFLLGEKIVLKRRKKPLSLSKIYKSFINIFFYTINIFSFLVKKFDFRKIKGVVSLSPKEIPASVKIKSFFGSLVRWLYGLKLSHKIYILILIVCVILFVQNISSVKTKKSAEENKLAYTELTRSIEQKQNQIDSNFLYNKNDEQIKALLGEMKQLLDKMPQVDASQKEFYLKYYKLYEQRFDKVVNIIRINDPKELANIKNINQTSDPFRLFLIKDNIYVGDKTGSALFRSDLKNNTTTSLTFSKTQKQFISATANNDDLYFLSDNEIIIYNTDNTKLTNSPLVLNGTSSRISAINAYNDKLYALDKNDGSIYRFSRSGNNFISQIKWLKEKTDLKSFNDFTIDGSIYIAFNNGKILKYLSGTKVDFQMDSVTPALKNPAKIFTSADINNFYVMDPVNKRLLVYAKSGKFLMQYYFEKFNSMKDFVVDEKGKIIYLLNDSSLYKVPMQELPK